jgi:hypothetical protein
MAWPEVGVVEGKTSLPPTPPLCQRSCRPDRIGTVGALEDGSGTYDCISCPSKRIVNKACSSRARSNFSGGIEGRPVPV